ncbi:hypothetical protein C8Q78DRAFT_739329 [Trametes maxima]|nr:hypothetical protein C8Q78DRAFT_739329 [Trametes maxima]
MRAPMLGFAVGPPVIPIPPSALLGSRTISSSGDGIIHSITGKFEVTYTSNNITQGAPVPIQFTVPPGNGTIHVTYNSAGTITDNPAPVHVASFFNTGSAPCHHGHPACAHGERKAPGEHACAPLSPAISIRSLHGSEAPPISRRDSVVSYATAREPSVHGGNTPTQDKFSPISRALANTPSPAKDAPTVVPPRAQSPTPAPDTPTRPSYRSLFTPSSRSPSPAIASEPRRSRPPTHMYMQVFERKIRGTAYSTVWTESWSEYRRTVPPGPLRAATASDQSGRLHLHHHESGVQVWMWKRVRPRAAATEKGERGDGGGGDAKMEVDGAEGEDRGVPGNSERRRLVRREWVRVYEGCRHPRLREHVLHFLDSGEPSWVKPGSAEKYKAGRRMRARIAASGEA